MNDDRLDELLDDASRTYRPPPEAPLDAIWSRVEAEAFAPAPARRAPGWRSFAGAIAATLVLGVALGRATVGRAPMAPAASATATAPAAGTAARLTSAADPYQRTAQDFLGRTAVLLAALPAAGHRGADDARLSEQAQQLLGTTRLLLDSPVGREERMKDLLEDLELVLAQVVHLQNNQNKTELDLIHQALDQRDVIPRLRVAAQDISAN